MKVLSLLCVLIRAEREPGPERAYYSDAYDRGDSLDNVLNGLDSLLDGVDCFMFVLHRKSTHIQP